MTLASRSPASTLSLALLGAELSALVGDERGAPSRVGRAIGYCSATITGVMRGETRPSALLLKLLAAELGAGPHVLARWEAWRVASLPRVLPWRLPAHVAPVASGVAPLRSHRLRHRDLLAAARAAAPASCAWCARTGARGDFGRDADGAVQCRVGEGCAREARAA